VAAVGQVLLDPYPALAAVDEDAARQDEVTLVLQVNGKLRDRMTVPADISEEAARSLALENPVIQRYLEGKTPRQVVVVPRRLVNIVL
jgi:leucyl-tRNA synthetase